MLRKRYLPLALLGAAAATIPGLAAGESSPPTTASFIASDTPGGGPYGYEGHSWHVAGAPNTQVTVAQGATVTFSYPEGKSEHNVDFGEGAHPSVCSQTEGPSSGSVPPLPNKPTKQGWSGSCTFNTPGTYRFMCDEHPGEMKGTIVVEATSQPPATTGPGTGTATTPTSTGPSGEATPGPLDTLKGDAVRIPSSQHGTSVRGSVQVAQGGSRLEVDALASAASLARAHHQVRVGRFVRSSAKAGRLTFAVALNARARRALSHHHRLPLVLRLALNAPGGSTLTRTLSVVLHR